MAHSRAKAKQARAGQLELHVLARTGLGGVGRHGRLPEGHDLGIGNVAPHPLFTCGLALRSYRVVQQQAERVGRLALQLREPAVAREPGSVAVLEGLTAQDAVIVEGTQRVRDGGEVIAKPRA